MSSRVEWRIFLPIATMPARVQDDPHGGRQAAAQGHLLVVVTVGATSRTSTVKAR
jgi:hypothetical protein